MNRTELVKHLRKVAKAKGEELVLEEGARHTHAAIGAFRTEIPRHNEINEKLARDILRKARKS